jgi:hypothetical protein
VLIALLITALIRLTSIVHQTRYRHRSFDILALP